jgi:hypothetical protein
LVAHDERVRRSQQWRLVLRSKNQLWGAVAFGVLLVVFGVFGALQAGYLAAGISEASVAIACAAVLVGLTVRATVIADETGVTIRNPLGRTQRIRWSDIAAFKIGRYKLLRAVCLIELADGSVRHAWAIQLPNYARRPGATRESEMINGLNRELANRKTTTR